MCILKNNNNTEFEEQIPSQMDIMDCHSIQTTGLRRRGHIGHASKAMVGPAFYKTIHIYWRC